MGVCPLLSVSLFRHSLCTFYLESARRAEAGVHRDLTDSMYNSKIKPYVGHDDGTDLVVEHV